MYEYEYIRVRVYTSTRESHARAELVTRMYAPTNSRVTRASVLT